MRFLFFPRTWLAQAQTRPARTIWRPQYTVSARVFRNAKVGNPTHALCIGKAAWNGGVEMWLARAGIRVLKDLAASR
jgi:hypothetical protein